MALVVKKIVLTNTVSKAMNELSTLQSELLQMCCFWVCSHACKWLYEAVLTCRTHCLPLPVHDGYLAHLLRLAHVWCPHRQALLPWHCSDYATHSHSRSSDTAFVMARLITSHQDTQGLGYVCKTLVFDALAIRPRPLTVRWCWEPHCIIWNAEKTPVGVFYHFVRYMIVRRTWAREHLIKLFLISTVRLHMIALSVPTFLKRSGL